MKRLKTAGFTLIELMIVVAVIAILAMIAIPKMSELVRKGNEAGTVGNLGSVRSALHIYYLDTDETYPVDINFIIAPGSKYYNGASPVAYTVDHGRNTLIEQVSAINPATDDGQWGYVNDVNAGTDRGTFWIQCTHKDLKGKVWSQY